MSTETDDRQAAPVEQPIRLNYVPKLVARGEGRVYWDTPDGLPPRSACRRPA